MAQNQPSGKTPTSQTPRPPSTVPNDYDHLGVPRENINIKLSDTRRRQRRRQRHRRGMPNWIKASIAIGSALFAFGIVMLVIMIIAAGPIFRSLEPRYQQRLIDMAPGPASNWLESLKPTKPFDVLPTIEPRASSDAQQLLLTQDASPTASNLVDTPPPTLTPATTATPTGAVEGIPVGSAPSQTPTPLPVYNSPTPNVSPMPSWTPEILPTQVALPKQVKLEDVKYEQQGWNNCGPTTMTMALSYYGWQNNQDVAANWMKPNIEDKNVSPWQMVRFVNDQTGLSALYRYGGTTTVLKQLLAAGFPVVIEESINPAHDDWMGHYVLLIGYDDYGQHFLTFDSFLGYNQGDGRPSPYSTFDEHWRHFNRVFMVVYQPTREAELRAALGDYVEPTYGYETALAKARSEAEQQRDDKWAWFNMGTAYLLLNQPNNAALAFDQAFQQSLPWRMLWYQFGPYEAYFKMGDYNTVRALATATIGTTPYVEESYYWIGMVYAAEGNTTAAIQQFDKALRYNYNFFPAEEAKAAVQNGTFAIAQSPP